LSQIDRFLANMRGLFFLVTTETSTASRHNKSQNLQQKCGTWEVVFPNFFHVCVYYGNWEHHFWLRVRYQTDVITYLSLR
jgi:hypothetical protein